MSLAVRSGATLAVAGALHAAMNARHLRRPAAAPGPATTLPERGVPVLIPARDEAATIEACVGSLVGQPGVAEVVVLDDESSDATAVRAVAAGARVVAGTPPPPGWSGKPWAHAQLAAAVPEAEVLILVDADVVLAPGAVVRALALLDDADLDLLSPFPRQRAAGPAERLVQPLLQWSWLTTLPLRAAERSPRPSLTAACGQFLVLRRSALRRAGGFAAIRSEVLDDLALARAVKRAGGRVAVADGSDLATARMYADWPALRAGYEKSLWAAFGSPLGAAAVLAALAWVYVLPAAAALRGSRAGLVGYAAGVASRVVAARATGGRAWPDALAHPVSVLLFARLAVGSLVGRRRGRLRWKGRPVV